jgi:hypothetical protein
LVFLRSKSFSPFLFFGIFLSPPLSPLSPTEWEGEIYREEKGVVGQEGEGEAKKKGRR